MWKYVALVVLIIFCASGSSAVEEDALIGTLFDDLDPQNATNSTTAPETTPAETTTGAAESTTVVAVNITTAVPVTTSAVPVTTSSAPPTTPLPPPAVGKYDIHQKDDVNKTCLKVEMALRVAISDPHVQYNFPSNASTNGSECNATDNTQILKLTDQLYMDRVLSFIFVQNDKKYFVQNISFSYSPSVHVETSGRFFEASNGKSYLCNSETSVHVDNVTLTFSSVHLQAYGAQTFALAEECDADDKVGDVVPIAVGCALAALVVIVLIAYLVGRRRSRQRGYQSV